MTTAMDVARYFQAAIGSDAENDLTNLKLQKLCAYAQGLCLGLYDAPMFQEDMEAWKHGPVIPEVYEAYRQYGATPIASDGLSEEYARQPFTDAEKFILEAVKEWYGAYSASALRNRSHNDFPGKFGSKGIIAKTAIAQSFAQMDQVRKLKSCTPDMDAKQPLLSEEEFFRAISA